MAIDCAPGMSWVSLHNLSGIRTYCHYAGREVGSSSYHPSLRNEGTHGLPQCPDRLSRTSIDLHPHKIRPMLGQQIGNVTPCVCNMLTATTSLFSRRHDFCFLIHLCKTPHAVAERAHDRAAE